MDNFRMVPSSTESITLVQKLESFYSTVGNERVGFVTLGGEVVEVANISETPEEAFFVSAEDLIEYEDNSVATFHTHPNLTSNLSAEDHIAFRMWPDKKHFIIGSDGVRCYSVTRSGAVIYDDEANSSSR